MASLISRSLFFLSVITLFSCASTHKSSAFVPPAYTPASQGLYDSIVRMDSIWEDSYNHCRMDVQEQLLSDDLEFYHDLGGLMTSKTKLIEALKNNICGKVQRQLLKGSIEVYPIKDYGAVEMGFHGFHSVNDSATQHYAKFVHIWKKENDQWRITRVISLH